MPRVPVAQNQVGIAEVTGAKLRPADFSSNAALGEGMQQLGRAGQQFADAQAGLNMAMDETAAKKLDIEATERLRALLWTGDGAFYQQKGFDAVNARVPTEKAINDLRSELSGKATSELQRRMFGEVFDRRAGQEREGMTRYWTGELRREEERTSIARTETSRNEAITHADDPVRYETEVQTGISEIRQRADKLGTDPAVADLEIAKYRSDIRSSIVEAKIKGDPVAAMAYLEDHRDEILPDAEGKLRNALYAPMEERQAVADIDGYQGVTADVAEPTAKPVVGGGSTLSRMAGITAHTESGDRDRDRNGNIVTSPKGAQGRMQVMPGTHRDPGFGVKPAQNDSDAERARVGRDYLAAMMRRYNGDAAKAWGAYNAGPGRVDDAVKARGNAWLGAMPAETKGYVATNMAALNGGGVERYAPRRDDLAGIYKYIDDQPWSFDRKQAARREADNRVSRNDALLARQRRAADEEIDRIMDDRDVRSIKDIPPSLLRNATPGTIRQVENILDTRNKAVAPKTDYGFMTTLSDAYGSDKAAFLAINPNEARAKLSNGDYEQYLGWRRDAMKPGTTKSQGQIDHSRIVNVSRDALSATGILTGNSKQALDPKMAARRGAFVSAMSDSVKQWQAINPNKAPSDDDLKRMASSLLLKTNGGALVFEAGSADLEGSISDATRNRIIRSLKAAGIPSTRDNIAEAYRRGATLLGVRPKE